MIKKKVIDKKYNYGFNDGNISFLKLPKGINLKIIKQISKIKNEPKWMLGMRLNAYKYFKKTKQPIWGPDLSFINFNNYYYYNKPSKNREQQWKNVPTKIRETFKKLGIQEAEAKFLNGITTQYDSEAVYHSLIEELKSKNIIFTDTDSALKLYPDLFKKYFNKLVSMADNKYASLNCAVWSGGSFIYIPKNTKLDKPLQSYFRINAQNLGQFERTIIIVDEGAELHYIEGCTAPIFSSDNLHAAVVEVFVEKNAKCKYTTIQNWSNNVLNLVTKRSIVKQGGSMQWIDGNIGARINMKYPSTILSEPYATGDCLSIAIAGKNIVQDAGAKMIHLAPHCKSTIISKSISFNGGDTRYRGFIKIAKNASNSFAKVQCDTLLLDSSSRTDTIPTEILQNNNSTLEHEATVSAINEEQLFYLMSRGLSMINAQHLIVMGFIEPFSKELPMEYAVELNKLIKMDMEGSVG